MRTPLKSIAKAALSRQLPILFILLIGANKDNRHLKSVSIWAFFIALVIGVQTITSCSSGDEPGDNNGSSPSNGNNSSSSGAGNGGGGGSEGITYTWGIEKIDESSFTMIVKWHDCNEDGTLEENTEKQVIDYRINGKTLSFEKVDFNGNPGNQVPLISTWTREPYSASCEEDDYRCEDYDQMSKAVFTQNSVTFVVCDLKPGEEQEREREGVVVKRKAIDCSTVEYTSGTEAVIVKYSGTNEIATYKGKTCTFQPEHSESEMRPACTEAYNKAKAEGGYAEDYYYDILDKDWFKCLKDKNFPEWL